MILNSLFLLSLNYLDFFFMNIKIIITIDKVFINIGYSVYWSIEKLICFCLENQGFCIILVIVSDVLMYPAFYFLLECFQRCNCFWSTTKQTCAHFGLIFQKEAQWLSWIHFPKISSAIKRNKVKFCDVHIDMYVI